MKCGTTSLACLLRDRPEDFVVAALPDDSSLQMECHFFDDAEAYEQGPQYYWWYFRDTAWKNETRWLFEKTPLYLYLPEALERIASYFCSARDGCDSDVDVYAEKRSGGQVAFIVLLRNPIERAVSQHNH